MFDIGFSELMVIAVVALIVIGPERLPKTARTVGHLFGRLQRYVRDVKADISREMELDELRKLQQQMQTAARDIETSVSTAAREVESGVRIVESELNAAAGSSDAPDVLPSPVAAPTRPAVPAAAAAHDESPRQGCFEGRPHRGLGPMGLLSSGSLVILRERFTKIPAKRIRI
jgi:sec-independent protein translocase protein TatB